MSEDSASNLFENPRSLYGSPPENEITGGRVLIVEDDETLGTMLASVAQRKGHPWTWTNTGLRGLRELAKGWNNKKPYEILLLDINLPQIDGIELCRICRDTRVGENNEAPGECLWIIGMSADTSEHKVTAMMNSGADDFLPKPITIESVAAKLTVAQANVQRRKEMRKKSWRPDLVD